MARMEKLTPAQSLGAQRFKSANNPIAVKKTPKISNSIISKSKMPTPELATREVKQSALSIKSSESSANEMESADGKRRKKAKGFNYKKQKQQQRSFKLLNKNNCKGYLAPTHHL